jgi:hypothetical protein
MLYSPQQVLLVLQFAGIDSPGPAKLLMYPAGTVSFFSLQGWIHLVPGNLLLSPVGTVKIGVSRCEGFCHCPDGIKNYFEKMSLNYCIDPGSLQHSRQKRQ